MDAHENRIQREAREDGHRIFVMYAYDRAAAYALVRQWAGEDEPLARRDKEIERLGRLVIDAIYALRAAGNDKEAARLDRKFHG
jgi:hypothetical protein